MSIFEVILIGIGLSMDAFAVCISNAMCYPGLNKRRMMQMPIAFGLFQGIMPILGFFLGSLFAEFISRYAGIVTLLILGIIGGNMIKESFSKEAESCPNKDFTLATLLIQAIATSIDAFAVGVSFCAEGAPIFSSAIIITITTFLCSTAAVFLGQKFGKFLGSRAELLGGAILVLIGVKAVLPF